MNKTASPTLSPSIHEATIARHFPRDGDDSTLTALHDGVKLAREACDRAAKMTATVLSNDMETLAKRHQKARDVGFDTIKGATTSLDAALAKAANDVASITAKTRGPAPPKDSSLAREMRERLAALPKDRQQAIISAAIANDDDALIGALLSAPAWLTGLADTSLEMTRSSWARKHHAADLDRGERLSKAIVDAKRAGMLANSFVDSLTDAEMVNAAKLQQKAADDAIKAAKAG